MSCANGFRSKAGGTGRTHGLPKVLECTGVPLINQLELEREGTVKENKLRWLLHITPHLCDWVELCLTSLKL